MNVVDRQRSATWRILIAEDHPIFRSALRQMLSKQSDLEVVGEAADGQEALELCRRLRPNLVLMDLRMPRMDGLAATRAIRHALPGTAVLVLTALDNPSYLSDALKAGAAGYVLKYATPQQVIDAIQRVLTGESPLNQEVAMRLLLRLIDETPRGEFPDPAFGEPSEECLEPSLLELLSSREIEVLRLVAQGQTNKDIARNLLVGVSTVKKHVRQIIAKLGAADRTQAAVRAIELGLLPDQGRE